MEDLAAEDRKRLAGDPCYYMDLYTMDGDGGNLRRLTETPGYDGGPFFNTQGNRITWRRFTPDGTRAEIWSMNIDGKDWRPLSFSETGEPGAAPVVLAGYRILAPFGKGFPAYDSYRDLDVKDKWVHAYRYLPENIYYYSYALKVNRQVYIQVERDGRRETFLVTPASR